MTSKERPLKRNTRKPHNDTKLGAKNLSENLSVVTSSPQDKNEAGCKHHWIIEMPHGATSMGTCKMCGASKEFRNSSADQFSETITLFNKNRRDFEQPLERIN